MAAAGLFDHQSSNPVDLSDVQWLDLERIVSFKPVEWMTDAFIPFAKEARASYWAWWPELMVGGEMPVVYSPRDSNTAEIFAPSFEAFLYMKMLGDLADLDLDGSDSNPDSNEIRALFSAKVQRLAPYLPITWTGTLASILQNKPSKHEDGTVGFLSASDLTAMWRRDIIDPRVGLELIQFPDDVTPRGPSKLFKSIKIFGVKLSVASFLGHAEPLGFQVKHGESELIINDEVFGPLSFGYQWVGTSYYNPRLLKPHGLERPPSISIICPLEGTEWLFKLLHALLSLDPVVATCNGVVPLATLLHANNPWADLRLA